MSRDIVTTLRTQEQIYRLMGNVRQGEVLARAAEEIERLRELLEAVKKYLTITGKARLCAIFGRPTTKEMQEMNIAARAEVDRLLGVKSDARQPNLCSEAQLVPPIVRCASCVHWEEDGFHAMADYGQCRAASTDGAPMVAGDEIAQYDPYLLTKPDFGCLYGVVDKAEEPC